MTRRWPSREIMSRVLPHAHAPEQQQYADYGVALIYAVRPFRTLCARARARALAKRGELSLSRVLMIRIPRIFDYDVCAASDEVTAN